MTADRAIVSAIILPLNCSSTPIMRIELKVMWVTAAAHITNIEADDTRFSSVYPLSISVSLPDPISFIS